MTESEDTKPKSRECLSPDGKWRSFPRTPNLMQYISTGTFYGRVRVNGKLLRQSLETTVFTNAKALLADFIKKERKKKQVAGAPVTFGDARKLYEADIETAHDIEAGTKRYRRFCLAKLAATWPELDKLKLSSITTVQNVKRKKTANKAITRKVPIIGEMKDLLARLRTEQADRAKPTDRVCVFGECEKSLTKACAIVGISRITHHDLRHLFATRCIESGVDIPTVSRWLGHSDGGALAMKVYGHLRNEHSQEMAKKVKF